MSAEKSIHPYLSGNFAPRQDELFMVPCLYSGQIPECLIGGQYIRNGPNPRFTPGKSKPYHWFDGDGMLHGVYFHRLATGEVEPRYVNKFLRTDVLIASEQWKRTLLPSIATIVTNKLSFVRSAIRAGLLAFLSGSARISTANTAVLFHHQRLLATCESGPPMEVSAPDLQTLDWHVFEDREKRLGRIGTPDEWTTAHPIVDPVSGEMMFYGYNIFVKPFVRYSVISKDGEHLSFQQPIKLHDGVPKMMHSFACSQKHSIILDLPLTMSAFNLLSRKPMLHFDKKLKSRFGVIPRYYNAAEDEIIWFETASCMIFHCVNAWDEYDDRGNVRSVSMVACRFRTAKLAYAAGDLAYEDISPDVVHLYYYKFDLQERKVAAEYPISDFPFEYPSMNPDFVTSADGKYVYGGSMREGSFDAALSGAKIDVIVKADYRSLVEHPPENVLDETSITPPRGEHIDTIQLPKNVYASEATFLPKAKSISEDDGYLVLYVYNEIGLDKDGSVKDDSLHSQLWVIDAHSFVLPPVAIVDLPERVPYGLHGTWLSPQQLQNQAHVSAYQKEGEVKYHTNLEVRTFGSIKAIQNLWRWRISFFTLVSEDEIARRLSTAKVLSWFIFFVLTYNIWLALINSIIHIAIHQTQSKLEMFT